MASAKKEITNTIFLNILSQAISLITSVILIRLLSPDSFGLIGLIIPLIIFIKFFHSFGTMNSIISSEKLEDEELSSLFWGKLCFSSIISMALVLCVPLIIKFYNEERLEDLVIYFAIAAVISSISELYLGILYRGQHFFKIAKIEFFALAISCVVSILIALKGFEIEALIAKEILLSSLTLLGVIYFAKWYPRSIFSIKAILRHATYGIKATASSIVSWGARFTDDILIGRYFSTSSLGLYAKSYNLLTFPNSFLISIALKIGIPLIAKEQTDEGAIMKYKQMLKLAFTVNAPVGLILFFTCDTFVPHIFGYKWIGMIDLIKVFSVLSIVQVLGPLDNIIFQGRSKMTELVKYSIVLSLIQVLSIILGFVLTRSLTGIAIFYSIGSIGTYFIAQRIVSKAFKISQYSLINNLKTIFYSIVLTFGILGIIELYYGGILEGSLRYLYIILVPVFYCIILAIISYQEFKALTSLILVFVGINKEDA